MTLPDTNFLLTLLPVALAAIVAAFVIVAAFSWLNTSRKAEKAETEVEQLRIEKDQEHVAKHLALTERDSAVRAFQVRNQEFTDLENQVTDLKARAARTEASFRAEEQRRLELERLVTTRGSTTLALSGALTDAGQQLDQSAEMAAQTEETVAALTSNTERMRAELDYARAELARKDARLGDLDALKRQLDLTSAQLLDAQTATQTESRKVASISTVAGSALLIESQLREAQARVSELERLANDREARLRLAEAAPFTSASDEAGNRTGGLQAAVGAAHQRIDALNTALSRRDAQLAAHQAETRRLTFELNARASAASAPGGWEAERTRLEAALASAQAQTSAPGAAVGVPLATFETANLERELADARAELNALRVAGAVNVPAAADQAELERELAEARAECARLRADLAAAATGSAAVGQAELEQELGEARSELARRGARIAELNAIAASDQRPAPPDPGVSTPMVEQDGRDAVIAGLRAEVGALSEASAQSEMRQQASMPAAALAILPSDLEQTGGALEAARADAADQEARIELLRQDLNSALTQSAALTEEKAALATTLGAATTDAKAAAGRLAAMASTVAGLETSIREARAQLDGERTQSQRAESSLKASEARLAELNTAAAGIAALSAQLADARARSLALEQVVADRDRRIDSLAAQAAQADTTVADQQAALADARAQAALARNALESQSAVATQFDDAEAVARPGSARQPDLTTFGETLPAAAATPSPGIRRDRTGVDQLVAAAAEKDQQISTLRQQLDDSMGSLRRAMSELTSRDLQLTEVSARLDDRRAAPERAARAADSGATAGASGSAAALGSFQASAGVVPFEASMPVPAAPATPQDALEEIIGIGPTIARRLRMAGIRTFKQIAESSPDRLEEVARLPDWRKSNFKAWIEQARQLAG